MKNGNSIFVAVVIASIVIGGAITTVGFREQALASYRNAQVQTGTASYYTTRECHARTASGEALDDNARTAASWFYPFGTELRVTSGSRSTTVRVNDRGPNKRLVARGRVLDLSERAFSDLAPLSRGVIPVSIEMVR